MCAGVSGLMQLLEEAGSFWQWQLCAVVDDSVVAFVLIFL